MALLIVKVQDKTHTTSTNDKFFREIIYYIKLNCVH